MTERKIDPSYVDRLVRDEALHSLGELCKSLIADGERLDWLEKERYDVSSDWSPNKTISFRGRPELTLRQAIDERMVQ